MSNSKKTVKKSEKKQKIDLRLLCFTGVFALVSALFLAVRYSTMEFFKILIVTLTVFIPFTVMKLQRNLLIDTAVIAVSYGTGFILLGSEGLILLFFNLPVTLLLLFSDTLSEKKFNENRVYTTFTLCIVMLIVSVAFLIKNFVAENNAKVTVTVGISVVMSCAAICFLLTGTGNRHQAGSFVRGLLILVILNALLWCVEVKYTWVNVPVFWNGCLCSLIAASVLYDGVLKKIRKK